jgi:hypothetical protein
MEQAVSVILWLLSLCVSAYLVLGAPRTVRQVRAWMRMLRETRGERRSNNDAKI